MASDAPRVDWGEYYDADALDADPVLRAEAALFVAMTRREPMAGDHDSAWAADAAPVAELLDGDDPYGPAQPDDEDADDYTEDD